MTRGELEHLAVHLAARDKVGAAHIHITRHLSLRGDRITTLAKRAGTINYEVVCLPDGRTEREYIGEEDAQ